MIFGSKRSESSQDLMTHLGHLQWLKWPDQGTEASRGWGNLAHFEHKRTLFLCNMDNAISLTQGLMQSCYKLKQGSEPSNPLTLPRGRGHLLDCSLKYVRGCVVFSPHCPFCFGFRLCDNFMLQLQVTQTWLLRRW